MILRQGVDHVVAKVHWHYDLLVMTDGMVAFIGGVILCVVMTLFAGGSWDASHVVVLDGEHCCWLPNWLRGGILHGRWARVAPRVAEPHALLMALLMSPQQVLPDEALGT